MCRWLTYMGEPIYLDELILKPQHSLARQSLVAREATTPTNGDGFGFGWYGGRDIPGRYRDILPAWNDDNLKNLAYQIRSHLFFAHVRAGTGTPTARANCHPFRLGKWLFMHNGVIGDFERVRRPLENLIPDDLYANRIGTTDSEVFFLILAANGLEDDVAGAFRKTVGQVLSVMAERGGSPVFRMTAALTDGETLYALRFAQAADDPSLYWWRGKGRMLVVSEPFDDDAEGWRPIAPGSFLIARGDGAPDVRPFEVKEAA